MPELPEVETVRRGLAPALVGQCIAQVEQRRADLRFAFPPEFSARIAGQTVQRLDRRAKYLLAALSSGETLVMHLGMTGRFRVEQGADLHEPGSFYLGGPAASVHDHVVFHVKHGARVTYNDARRFGFMQLVLTAELDRTAPFSRMGIEPLGGELTGDTLARLFRARRTPLKAALLDQRMIAGLGNIYVCEALHRARLSPETAAGWLATASGRPRAVAHRLAAEIQAVLEEAITVGGSTLRDHAQVDGTAGGFQERFRVYDREGDACTTAGCNGIVARFTQGGRSTFHCPVCQTKRGG